jgi:hypothetical protein
MQRLYTGSRHLSLLWAGILGLMMLLLGSCGGSSPMTSPDVGCPAIAKASIVVTVRDSGGGVATSEILQLDRLASTFTSPAPVLFVQCGEAALAPSPRLFSPSFSPRLVAESCDQISLGVEQTGSFTLTTLETNTTPLEVNVPSGECGVVTQSVTLVQGSPNLLACSSEVQLGCRGILLPGPQGCNPLLENPEPIVFGDFLCGDAFFASGCEVCELR